MEKIKAKTSAAFNFIFDAGVIIKGIDGFVELIAGLMLLVVPSFVHKFLMAVVGEATEGHTHVHQFVAQYVARLDGELAKSGLTFLIIFLLAHGIVKIVLVFCLLKKIVRAYPAALVVLGAFLVYQVYVFIQEPSIGMALFCVLDVAIIGLVWREYQVLMSEKMV